MNNLIHCRENGDELGRGIPPSLRVHQALWMGGMQPPL